MTVLGHQKGSTETDWIIYIYSRCSSILTSAVSNSSIDTAAISQDIDGDRKVNTAAANVGDLVRPKDRKTDWPKGLGNLPGKFVRNPRFTI